MTSNSLGRVRTCWSVMSAIASFTRIFPAASADFCSALAASSPLAAFVFSQVFPGVDLPLELLVRQGVPPLHEGPSVNFMMFPLWTKVTLFRWFRIAYSIAARTSRSVAVLRYGLDPESRSSPGKRIFL